MLHQLVVLSILIVFVGVAALVLTRSIIVTATATHQMGLYLDLTNGLYASQYQGDSYGGKCGNFLADWLVQISMAISMYHYAANPNSAWVQVESQGDYNNHSSVCDPYSLCHSNTWAPWSSWQNTYGEIHDVLFNQYCCYQFIHWTVAFYENGDRVYNRTN